MMPNRGHFILNPNCSLKRLENPSVYNRVTNDLYELDEEGFEFLRGHQTLFLEDFSALSSSGKKFVRYCIKERILCASSKLLPQRNFEVDHRNQPTLPSLRYLLVHLTKNCNLRCKHCYDAPNHGPSLPLGLVENLLSQMVEMQGLIVLLSGGEPLCYPFFWELNKLLPCYDLRFELLTNGTKISQSVAEKLNVHHVQVSIDGMKESHEFLRGTGTFERALRGIRNLLKAGKEVSISTMVHKRNVRDFEPMRKLLHELGIKQWLINAPSQAGRWKENLRLSLPLEKAVEIMAKFSEGEGPHESKTNLTCGSHICTVISNGDIFPCPVLTEPEMLMGRIQEKGLREAWAHRRWISVADLEECKGCEFLAECRGGCRYRAKEHGRLCGRDPVLCAVFKKDGIGRR